MNFKVLLLLAGAVLWTTPARAYEPSQPVMMAFSDTMTVTGVKITTGTPIELTQYGVSGSTGGVGYIDMRWRYIAVQNLDHSGMRIYCDDSITVTTTETSMSVGVMISTMTPGSIQGFSLTPGQRFYCICDTAAGTNACNAVLIRGR